MDQHYSVRIGEKTYSKTFQTQGDYATSWKSVLQNAHGTTVFCLCPGRETRKLAVKHRDKTDEYHLARFANTGHEHFHDCHFYAPAPDRSGLQGYNTGVVVEGDDQTVQVRLAHGIREREAGTQPGPVADHNHPVSPGHRKPAMTILGLL
ncbi:MAG TPA: DUF1173 family protein, partial [Rhodanobacter sp.]|nr:DUF1173 family protein [Rhodanobacter sp.]